MSQYTRLLGTRVPADEDTVPTVQTRINYGAVDTPSLAALVIATGQSNADGTQTLPAGDEIASGDLPNVWTLDRATTVDASGWTDEATWVWVPFTSDRAVYSLTRPLAGHFKNFTVEFAREWQARIDGGEALPDLYMPHLSWSGNGFANYNTNDRFNPLSDTHQGQGNIWQGSLKVHRWALTDLLSSNLGVAHLGVVNNQWEQDGGNAVGAANYLAMVQGWLHEFDKQVGQPIPYGYYTPAATANPNYQTIRDQLLSINQRPSTSIDGMELPYFVDNGGSNGIFTDSVHYTNQAHDDLVAMFYDKGGHRGILLTGAGS
jgi:hypothetical protein